MVADKLVLIAHHAPAVTERFAAALTDARHAFRAAASEEQIRRSAADRARPLSLLLLDVGLVGDGAAFVRDVRLNAGRPLPVVVFAGSLTSALEVPALTALGVGYINEHAASAQILPALAPHLFPESFNRRAHARIAIGLPVTFRVGQAVAGAVTIDIARSGLAIRTLNPLPKSTSVQLKFKLPGSAEIEAAGRVIWSDSKVGMGVQFEKLSSNDQRVIDAFMDGEPGGLSF